MPVGDAYASVDAFEAETAPGDLIVYYGGWVPYVATGDGRTLRGAVAAERLEARLWGPDGVRAKADGAAAPAPNLLAACPDIRAHEGFDGFRARAGAVEGRVCADEACAVARRRDVAIVPTSRLGTSPGRRSVPGSGCVDLDYGALALDVGYAATPALGDVDGSRAGVGPPAGTSTCRI